MDVKFLEAGLKRRMVEATETGMHAVASILVPRLKSAVSLHNPTHKQVKYQRKSKSGAKSHTTFDHGAPVGGPPWHRTGAGLQSIASELVDDGTRLRIGVRPQGIHLLYLDQGVKYPTHGAGRGGAGAMMQWPWAGSTVKHYMPVLKQIFMAGIRGK